MRNRPVASRCRRTLTSALTLSRGVVRPWAANAFAIRALITLFDGSRGQRSLTKFGKLNLFSPGPPITSASDHQQPVLDEDLQLYVIIDERCRDTTEKEIDLSFAQFSEFQSRWLCRDHAHNDVRMAPRQFLDDG